MTPDEFREIKTFGELIYNSLETSTSLTYTHILRLLRVSLR